MIHKGIINKILAFPKDKQDEVKTVVQFLNNEGIKFKLNTNNISVQNDEPVDVYVRDINKKFQVIVGDPQQHEILGRTKPNKKGIKKAEFLRRPSDNEREFIIRPLQNKAKYGGAACGIILLIDCPFAPKFLENLLQGFNPCKIEHKNKLDNLGFEQIYWVCFNRNLTRDILFN